MLMVVMMGEDEDLVELVSVPCEDKLDSIAYNSWIRFRSLSVLFLLSPITLAAPSTHRTPQKWRQKVDKPQVRFFALT